MASIVNDARFPNDLSRLNEAERRVLGLLAAGHTAKSIAAALDTSTAAVNERLREARRKTGVGSSRELARLLKAQENRDERIGVASGGVDMVSNAPSSGTPARSSRKATILMPLILLTGVVGATLALQPGTPAGSTAAGQPFTDSVVGDIFAPADPAKRALIPTTERDYVHPGSGEPAEAALRRLHAEVRAGRRGDVATKDAETALAAVYKDDHPIKLSGAPLRVLCSAELCEVATTTQVPTSQAEIDATLGEVQGAALRQRAEALGLQPVYMFFGLHPAGDRAAYLGYWARRR